MRIILVFLVLDFKGENKNLLEAQISNLHYLQGTDCNLQYFFSSLKHAFFLPLGYTEKIS